jgi:hypothetical protein
MDIEKAIRGSIKKWLDIRYGGGLDQGCDNCALCDAFRGEDEGACEGCPVKQKTGQICCSNTPIDEWFAHMCEHQLENDGLELLEYEDGGNGIFDEPLYKVYCQKCKDIADKEIKFLKGLLHE